MGYEIIKPQVKCILTMVAAKIAMKRFTTIVRSYDDEILIINVISTMGKSLVN